MFGYVLVLCFSYRAYERAEAVTVGDGPNSSIYVDLGGGSASLSCSANTATVSVMEPTL